MTSLQRRVTVTVAVIVGLTLLVTTGLTFLAEPMAEDLSLTDDAVEGALVAPTIASLLVVFVAGRAGDRIGQRRTIVVAGAVFTIGAVVLATAQAEPGVGIGLALCGAGAIVIQVVALSLLQHVAPDGRAHVAAFTTFGMVFPIAFLVLPIATALMLAVVNWRWVPVTWAACGVVMMVMARVLLERSEPCSSSGEWASPILAGVALMAGTRALDQLDADPVDGRELLILGAVCVVATVACLVVMRTATHPGFSLRPILGTMMRPLMIGVAVVTLIQILTYVSIAMEYLYEMTPFEVSLAIAPAQVGAVVGAKVVAGRLTERWGFGPAGRGLLLVTGLVMLLLVFMEPGTPPWYLVFVSTLFSLTGMAALTVLNLDIMGRAPADSTGAVSAFRTAASSVGSAVSMAVLGAVVLSSVTMSQGVSEADTADLVELAAALRLDGVVGFVIAVVGWAILEVSARRNRSSVAAGRPGRYA